MTHTAAIWILTLASVLHQAAVAAEPDLAEREEQAILAAVRQVAPAVVRIRTVGGLAKVGRVALGEGPCSGLVVSADGYIVSSSFNFARQPATILVQLPGGASRPAKLVARDHSRSLVLLKVDLREEDPPLTTAEPAPDEEVRPGAWAIAVGRTFTADQPNVSVGIVSAVNRIWGKAIQTDAKISPSNYGGPLVDIQGRVLGVLVPMSPDSNQQLAGAEWYDSGIGFAVPYGHIQKILPRLKGGTDLHPGLLGINLKGRDAYGEAPVIAAVRPGSPARAAGIQAGDTILQAGGQPVINHVQLQHQLRPLYAGDKIRLVVNRQDRQLEFELSLADKLPPYAHPFLGILPRRDNRKGKGMVVRYVFPDSGAAAAGLKAGDRIVKLADRSINSRDDLYEVLTAHMPGEVAKVEWQRGTQRLKAAATLGDLPTEIPPQLPPARQTADSQVPSDVDVGVIEIKLAEFQNECLAYVPPSYDPAVPHGVVIWLPRPGRWDQNKVISRWRDHCAAHDLILLAPQASDPERWQRDEVEFVSGALARLAKLYEVDPARTVVYGREAGGAMAFYVFVADTSQIHGVAVVDTPMPVLLQAPPVEPANRVALFWSYDSQHPAASRIPIQAQRLTALNYPVTLRQRDKKGGDLDDQQLSELVRWIDSLDRI